MKKLLFFALICTVAMSCTKQQCQQSTQDAALNNILTRVSVRQYTGEAVSEQQTEQLLRAAMAAPSAVNKQPWAFIVVNDAEIIRQLGEALPYSRCSNGATLAIIPCGDLNKTLEGEAQQFWIQDVSAATENLLLAAHAMGLGAVWTALYPNADRMSIARNILNIPDNLMPLCVVPVGVPAEQPEVKNKWNTDNIHYNKW